MRFKNVVVLFFLFFAFSFSANAQGDTSTVSAKKILQRARDFTEQYFYDQAEDTYKVYLIKDTTNEDAYYELGMLQFTFLWKKEQAIKYLEKYIQLHRNKKDTLPEICNALGQCYQFVENYDKAIIFYESFQNKLKENDGGNELKKETDRYIEQCMFAQDHSKAAKGIKCVNVGGGVNTNAPEFDPVIDESGKNLYFTSVRPQDTSKFSNGEVQQVMYIASKTKDSLVNARHYKMFGNLELGSREISAGSISYDNNRFYVCKDDRLYVSTGADTTWGMPVMMSDSVNRGFTQNHAFVAPDGKTIYFVSSGSGSLGGTDIYKCQLQKNGRWGPAINLGSKINTPFDEEGPSVSADGKTLYFSSKGHVGFGGFDIFKSAIKENVYFKPENMGRPYNSSADDLFLKFNKAGEVGYFSSGRIKGYGDMDIYKITKLVIDECKTFENKIYPVTIDAQKAVDTAGVKLTYEWNMADGTKEYGTKFTHNYYRPGKYDVWLTTIDSLSTRKEIHDAYVYVSIPLVSHIEFICPDSVFQNDTVTFDGTSTMMKGKPANKFSWMIDEKDVVNAENKLKYIFKNSGTFTVKMQADFKCPTCKETEKYCYSKSITVLATNKKNGRKP